MATGLMPAAIVANSPTSGTPIETSLDPVFAISVNFPKGSTAIPWAPFPSVEQLQFNASVPVLGFMW